MDENNLGCRNLGKHAQKWQMQLPVIQCNDNSTLAGKKQPSFCLACGILVLEDPCELSMKKRLVLVTIGKILRNKPSDIVVVLPEEEYVTLHILSVILEIVHVSSEEALTSLAANCFVLLLCHLKSEKLGLAAMHRLITLVQEERNFQRSMAKFQIIGELLQIYPLLSRCFHEDEGRFLHYLTGGLIYPSDTVKLSVTNIFFLTYKSTSIVEAGHFVHIHVSKCTIQILSSTHDEEIILNSLGLLMLLIKDSKCALSIVMESTSVNTNFASITKNILLTKRPDIQICMAQCICIISQHQMTESCMNSLMECNIPELLFELLGTTNEILLESALCCIHCFAEYSAFFSKCHAMYGMESILRSTKNLVNMRNWRLTIVSLKLLTLLFSSDCSSAPDIMVFQVAIELLHSLSEVNEPTVFSVALKFLSAFLRKNNLPWSLPVSELLSTLEMYFTAVAKFLRISFSIPKSQASGPKRRNWEKCSVEETILRHGFQVLIATSKLSSDFSANPLTMEETFSCPTFETNEQSIVNSNNGETKPREGFLQLSLQTIDKLFIPFTLNLHLSTRIGQIACACLINALSEIYENHWENNKYLLEITQKIFCCGLLKCFFGFTNFIDCTLQSHVNIEETKEKTATCVYYMLRSILKKEKNADDAYLRAIEIGIKELNDRIENCTILLSEQCPFGHPSQDLFNVTYTQLTLLCLNYVSFRYGYGIVSEKVLLPHLICFTLRNSELPSIPLIALKHMTYLLAVCSYDIFYKDGVFPTGFLEAHRILLDVLSKLSTLSDIYTRDKLVLWWCFIQENKSNFTLFVFNDWLSTATTALDEDKKFLIQLLAKNGYAQAMFVECFQSQEAETARKAFLYLKHVLTNEVSINVNSFVRNGFTLLLGELVQKIPSNLVKIFLTSNEGNSFNDEKIAIFLNCLNWCQSLVGANSQTETELKLVFYITGFASMKLPENFVILIACFDYLGSTINPKSLSFDHRAWHIVSGHTKLLKLLEQCLMDGNDIGLQQATLSLLGNIVSYQLRNALQLNNNSDHRIKVSTTQVFKWLESSACMQILTYDLLSRMIESNFQNTIIQIITLVHPFFGNSQDGHLFLSRSDFRQLYNYLQNAVLSGEAMKNVAIPCLMNVLNFVRRRDPELERHLILQPCNSIMLADKLMSRQMPDVKTRLLLEKWLSFKETNPFLITMIHQFALKLCDFPNKQGSREIVSKLCNGPYGDILNEAIKNKLQETHLRELQYPADKNLVLFDNVEKLVQTCIGQVPCAQEDKISKTCNIKKRRAKKNITVKESFSTS